MKTVLITGISGFIGSKIAELLKDSYRIVGIDLIAPHHAYFDAFYPINLLQKQHLTALFQQEVIHYVVHTAAEKSLQQCEQNRALAYELNVESTLFLHQLTARAQAKFLFVSSDQVFDGATGFYAEDAAVAPINYYGQLKIDVERQLLQDPNAAICRTALVFGEIPAHQQPYFDQIKHSPTLVVQGYLIQHVLHHAQQGTVMDLPMDEWITPTSVELFARQIAVIIAQDICGIVHCCGGERISRYAFGLEIVAMAQLPSHTIRAVHGTDPLRPKDVSLLFKKSEQQLTITYPTVKEMLQPLISNVLKMNGGNTDGFNV